MMACRTVLADTRREQVGPELRTEQVAHVL
jgi:hypothetical protein